MSPATVRWVAFSILVALSLPARAAEPKVDFNGDGRADVFLRNLFTGSVSAWLINGSRVLQTASYGTVAPTTGWVPIGLDDFNGDGRADVFWFKSFENTTSVWFLDGGRVLQTVSYGNVPPSSVWQVQIPR
ncbi:MAG: VCBS repeat-containing protein [Thermodesulfobacteriota bacterium]